MGRRIADTLQSQHVPNYLRESDGAAERHGDPNVVAHPQIDSMNAAAHVDLLVQGFSLMHRGKRRRRRVKLKEKKELQIFRKTQQREKRSKNRSLVSEWK